jgi:hypothetical protein
MISNLNIIRITRIISGIGITLYGLMSHHYILGFMGVMVLLLGILNVGCPFNSCSIKPSKDETNLKTIEYEDIGK